MTFNMEKLAVLKYGRDVEINEMYQKHRFSKEIVSCIGKYLKSNNYMGLIQVGEDWLVILFFSLLSIACWKNLNDGWYWNVLNLSLYAIVLLIIGARQRSLADVLHQSSHGCLAENKQLNFILGTFFSGYLIFQSFSVYVESHVKLHHTFLGNPNKDPDYIGYIENSICGKKRSKQGTYNYIRNIISIENSINYIKYVINNRVWNKNENEYETVIRLGYWLLILCLLYYYGLMCYFTLYWIVPFITSNVWIGSLLELLEHFPQIDDANIEYIDILLTKNRVFSAFVNFFVGIHWESYHLVHHLFPKIPSWHYTKVHQILMNDAKYAGLDHNNDGLIKMIGKVIENSG